MPILTTDSAQPLAVAADLADYPGAPFADSVVLAAGESVRRDAGWLIAPAATETVVLDGDGGRLLMLPTLHLHDVLEVRDVSGDTPVVLTEWRKTRAGMIELTSGFWPRGFEVIEVDMVHGYDACPEDLLPALAFRAQQAKVNRASGGVRLGSLSISPGGADPEDERPDAVVARYRIPGRP